jgi:hypothetical protein
MNIWLVVTMIVEFIVLVLLALRVGTLLDKERNLINSYKVDDYPNDKEYAKQQSDNPVRPTHRNNNTHTKGEASQSTPKQILDAFPCLIIWCIHWLARIINHAQTKCKQNRLI